MSARGYALHSVCPQLSFFLNCILNFLPVDNICKASWDGFFFTYDGVRIVRDTYCNFLLTKFIDEEDECFTRSVINICPSFSGTWGVVPPCVWYEGMDTVLGTVRRGWTGLRGVYGYGPVGVTRGVVTQSSRYKGRRDGLVDGTRGLVTPYG